MLSLNYNILNFSQVTDFSDFYRTQQKEVSKIHSIIDSIKMLLHVPGNAIKLFIAEGERVYKIIFYSNSLDRVLGTAFIRDGLIFALLANETLSIIENAGLMGIPIPTIMKNAVELLNQKGDTK